MWKGRKEVKVKIFEILLSFGIETSKKKYFLRNLNGLGDS